MEKEFTGDLILLRGLPGSGKTTLAHIILEHPAHLEQEVLSIDDFFTNEYGEYNFDSTKLIEANAYCQFRCSERMREGKSRIVVANIFKEERDMEDYFMMAKKYKYRVHCVVVENRHDSENIHGVTEEVVEKMKNKFEVKL